jgi:hypothetical protein
LILVGFSAQRDGEINAAIRLKFPLRAGIIRSPGSHRTTIYQEKFCPSKFPDNMRRFRPFLKNLFIYLCPNGAHGESEGCHLAPWNKRKMIRAPTGRTEVDEK